MQVDQPHHAPHNLREFALQYAMIVLSILTALALDRVAVNIQDHLAANASRVRIEAELARNAAGLRQTEQANREGAEKVSELLTVLAARLKAGQPMDAQTVKLLPPLFQHFTIQSPTFQRSAWDAAIADQSAGHLPPADLRRYSEIYAEAADASSTSQMLIGGEWLTHGAELSLDYRLGTVDERSLANLLVRYLLAARSIGAMQQALSTLIASPPSPSQPAG